MNTHKIGVTIAVAALAGMLAIPNALRIAAQAPARDAAQSALPVFDVASVTPNKSGDPGGSFGGRPGGQVIVRNNTLRNMIRNAYGLQEFQIVGGPEWINADRFDIVAKAADNAPPTQVLLMVRSLLADRFKLAVHTETREIPVYALVMARSDGRPGPQLRPAAVDCAALAAARGRGAPAPAPAPPGERPTCGMRTVPGRMMAGGYALTDVARNLSPFTGRIVVDKTGLNGTFDLDLAWTPDQIPTGPLPPGAQTIDPNGPSLFTAVQEQLGLKLDSQRGPVEVLVIDRAEQPTVD
jgi:uncharacterized protein (TIGR03435 family)